MKKVLILALVLLVTVASAAVQADGAYLFRTLNCVGAIRQQPRAMHDDYKRIGLRLRQFLTTRRDGSRIPSLAWNVYYGQTDSQVRERMRSNRSGSEVWYTGLLKSRVIRGREVISRDGEGLVLELLSRGARQDQLKGSYGRVGTVVGDTAYVVNCTASK